MFISAAMNMFSILFFSPVSVRLNDDDVDDVDDTDDEAGKEEDPDREMKQYITDDEEDEEGAVSEEEGGNEDEEGEENK